MFAELAPDFLPLRRSLPQNPHDLCVPPRKCTSSSKTSREVAMDGGRRATRARRPMANSSSSSSSSSNGRGSNQPRPAVNRSSSRVAPSRRQVPPSGGVGRPTTRTWQSQQRSPSRRRSCRSPQQAGGPGLAGPPRCSSSRSSSSRSSSTTSSRKSSNRSSSRSSSSLILGDRRIQPLPPLVWRGSRPRRVGSFRQWRRRPLLI